MSYFSYLFDSEWMQRSDLNRLDEKAKELEARVASSGSRSMTLESQVAELRRDVSHLMLTMETMLRIMADQGVCSREDFIVRMRAIDAEDGVEDGQLKPRKGAVREMVFCDACQHFNAPKLKACYYCGRLFGPRQ